MMRFLWSILALTLFAFMTQDVLAQRRMFGDEMGKRPPERLEQFKKMRLVEILKLNEEDAVRFFSKQSAHEEKVGDLMKSRNDLLDELEHIVHEKGDAKKLEPLTDQVMSLDQNIFAERQRFQNESRKLLSAEQFAKFLAFERNFNRKVRDAMEEIHRDRRERRDD